MRYMTSMHMSAAGRCLAAMLLIRVTRATFGVRSTTSDVMKTYPSAVFTYFSNNEEKTLHDYPVVSIDGKQLCNPPRDLIDGKIVLAILDQGAMMKCWPNEVAKSCAMNGAVAIVSTLFHSPPGLVSNMHWTFNPTDEGIGIPYVGVAAVDFGLDVLDEWRNSTMVGMVASLGPPYSQEYNNLFDSPLWFVVFQIILPIFALLVTIESIVAIHRRVRIISQNKLMKFEQGLPVDATTLESAPLLVCVIESMCCFAIGVILVLGEYGPIYLPFSYHYFFAMQLTGSAFFTTLVTALIMHEKRKFVAGFSTNNDVLKYYRKTIIVSMVICFGPDFVIGGLAAFDPRAASGKFALYFGIYGLGQFIVAIYFSLQAWALYQPLHTYISHPESHPRPVNEAQIRFLARILMVSGLALFLNSGVMVFLAGMAISGVRVSSVYVYFASVFLFSASRISISYCQVIVCAGPYDGSILQLFLYHIVYVFCQVILVSSKCNALYASERIIKFISKQLLSMVVFWCARKRVQDDITPEPAESLSASSFTHNPQPNMVELAFNPMTKPSKL